MYALRLRSPHSNPKIFVKPVLPNMDHIVVPKRFHDVAGHEINDIVHVKDPVGNTFNLSYLFNEGEYRIGGGLNNIGLVHQIQNTVMMHFIYRGHARFDIHIFDPFCREITYKLAPELPAQVNDNIGDVENNDVINTSSDEESSGEDEPVQWMEMIWETDISASQIYDGRIVTISSQTQQAYFPHLPPVINVLLPNDTIAQWHITWHPSCHPTTGASSSGGRIGQLGVGWCDFYMNDIINHDNYLQVHRIELWESSMVDHYIVFVYDV